MATSAQIAVALRTLEERAQAEYSALHRLLGRACNQFEAAAIAEAAGKNKIEVLRQGEVKSYAPAISHYVIDFRVTF